MRRSLGIATLASAGLVISTVALGIVPAQADRVGSDPALTASQARSDSAQVTIMGDSHTLIMINDVFPGEYSSGDEGTLVNGRFHVFAINGIKLRQVMRGKGVVKAGVSAVGTTNVSKWRKALRAGPDTIVVNLGTNDGGPKATDIDRFMRIAGRDRQVFWVKPFYSSCPACRRIHDYQLDTAAQRHANLHLVRVNDLGLTLRSDGLHAYGKTNSRVLWNRINDTISAVHTTDR
jgi:hypothetical protein